MIQHALKDGDGIELC